LVTGVARATVPSDQVRVYLEPPAQFETIGSVASTSALGVNAQANLNDAIADVRERAGAMGANGVLIDYQGVPGGAPAYVGVGNGSGGMSILPVGDGGDREVRARAIFVP
jgi:hypothetical protein